LSEQEKKFRMKIARRIIKNKKKYTTQTLYADHCHVALGLSPKNRHYVARSTVRFQWRRAGIDDDPSKEGKKLKRNTGGKLAVWGWAYIDSSGRAVVDGASHGVVDQQVENDPLLKAYKKDGTPKLKQPKRNSWCKLILSFLTFYCHVCWFSHVTYWLGCRI